jgi:hypothetical protein
MVLLTFCNNAIYLCRKPYLSGLYVGFVVESEDAQVIVFRGRPISGKARFCWQPEL